MNCTLCGSKTEVLENWREKDYYKCKGCNSIMLHPDDYPSKHMEKERYEEHNNDVNDVEYQNFVSPIVNAVLSDYEKEDIGLDFGAGTGPVISKLLRDKDYNIKIYDPFFANYKERLEEKYDYIVCCEVMEHFHNPKKEFKLLKSMLNPEGSLYCMTNIYSEDIDFIKWNYKNDLTHVFFYHQKALEWIKDKYGFSSLKVKENLISFTI